MNQVVQKNQTVITSEKSDIGGVMLKIPRDIKLTLPDYGICVQKSLDITTYESE